MTDVRRLNQQVRYEITYSPNSQFQIPSEGNSWEIPRVPATIYF
jgi:hypothetical protein